MNARVTNGVQRATSTITLSNPVQKRFITKIGEEKPQVKVIVTETLDDSKETFQTKPRKPRKADLSKCIKERDSLIPNDPSKSTNKDAATREQFIYLGDTEGLELEGFQSSFSLQRFTGEEETKNGDVVYYVQCPECNKKLKQKSYRSHVRTHLGAKQFKCDLCGDRFTRRNDVMRHKRLIHEKPRDFKCEKCEKYFISEENLASHKHKHNLELRCRICQHGFGKKEYYENHIKFVHPNGGHNSRSEESLEDPDNPEEVNNQTGKQGELDPSILRKGEKRKANHVNEREKASKVMYLGGSEPIRMISTSVSEMDHQKNKQKEEQISSVKKLELVEKLSKPTETSAVKLSSVSTKLDTKENIPANLLDASKQGDDAIHIVDSSGNVGQILKISDGTFMIVDCDEGNTDSQPNDQDNSQDAVQTLIDAVQELIQTHEACEQEPEDSIEKEETETKQEIVDKNTVYISEESRLGNCEAVPDGATVILAGEEGSGQVISEEVWRNLKEVYPDAEFVVVTNQ
eukprot:TRINITY_DN14927_c0_g1_i1.p1 TRINITY_DN14927_c0_g1~~TRINITY_DN14927_c0_g1_i1.p1  ORF type:complete len:533 (-),score=152.69 TRINITY_DN14927_c0_g1_i1:83-1633(-)